MVTNSHTCNVQGQDAVLFFHGRQTFLRKEVPEIPVLINRYSMGRHSVHYISLKQEAGHYVAVLKKPVVLWSR